MLVYRIEGIIGESLCTDENDRNAVAEMKHKYANRSEVFNNRLDMGKERGIEFTKEAMGKMRTVFRYIRKKDDFGNGRYVRSMLEQAQMNQAERLLKRDISSITDKELFTITAEDIETPAMEREERRGIGFAC